MIALYEDGRRGDALAAYLQCRDVLTEQLGVEPGPRLAELHQPIPRRPAADLRRRPRRRPLTAAPGRPRPRGTAVPGGDGAVYRRVPPVNRRWTPPGDALPREPFPASFPKGVRKCRRTPLPRSTSTRARWR